MSKRICPTLLIFLFLIAFIPLDNSILLAQNYDISGQWEINIIRPSSVSTHTKGILVSSGKTYTTSFDASSAIPLSPVEIIDIAQTPGGIISGNISDSGISININGTAIGDTVTFKLTRVIEIGTQGSVLYSKTTAVEDYSGKISGIDQKVIIGNLSGSYRQYTESQADNVGMSNTTTATYAGTFRVEISKAFLETLITEGPIGIIKKRDVAFSWIGLGGQGGIAGYNYQLNSQSGSQKDFTTKTEITFNNLPDGKYTFSVAAKDNQGNVDSTPAVREFVIGAGVNPNPNTNPDPPREANYGSPNNTNRPDPGDPINSATGNMYIITQDLAIPGRGLNLEFIRAYNSDSDKDGPMGYGWTHNYDLSLRENNTKGTATIEDEEGRWFIFAKNTDGSYRAQRGEYSTLIKNTNGFTWKKKDGKQYIFNLTGKLTRIKDRNDNAINLTYDNQGRLITITDTLNRQVKLEYNAKGLLTRFSDPLGRNFNYSYDSDNDLLTVTDPRGKVTSYKYDLDGYLIKKTNPNGDAVNFTYDNDGRCTSSSGENNQGRVDLVFDPANKNTVITDSKGNKTTHYYNSDYLITKVVNSQGGQTVSEWDTNLNLISRTDESDRATKMEYDSAGNLTKVTSPDNSTTTFTYEPNFNLLKTATDTEGNATTYTYDPKGNLLEAKDPLGNATTYTYNSFGQPLTVTNPLGKVSNLSYDTNGNLAASKDPLGNTTTFSYDAIGNLIQTKDAKDNITKYAYNELNQLTQITYPDNSINTFTYDANGNRASLTDAESRVTSYSYDQNNRVKSVTDPAGNKISYDYDTEGNLIAVTDQNNHKTKYSYDSLNRLVEQEDALGRKTKYEYGPAGSLLKKTDFKGQVISYEYDSLNRLKKILYPVSSVSFTYDSLGRRRAMVDSRGTTTYDYDKLSRLTKIDGPGQNDTLEYGYDQASNRISMTDPDGKATKYGYDDANRLSSITDPQGKLTNYEYDPLGNLTGIILPNGIKTVSIYDTLNRLSKLTQQKGANPQVKLAEFTYSYDRAGRRTSAQLLDGSRINYGYDAAGRLTSEVRTSSSSLRA